MKKCKVCKQLDCWFTSQFYIGWTNGKWSTDEEVAFLNAMTIQ